MQKQIFLLFAILTTLTFFSCSKEKDDPMVNYYFTVSSSDDYQSLTVDFNHIHAIQDNPASDDHAMRTVYIDGQELTFPTVNPNPVFLGQSSIEPCNVHGFNINTSGIHLRNNQGEIIMLSNPFLSSVETGDVFNINYEDQITVTFELQIEESISENANGELNFQPVFVTTVEKN